MPTLVYPLYVKTQEHKEQVNDCSNLEEKVKNSMDGCKAMHDQRANPRDKDVEPNVVAPRSFVIMVVSRKSP